MTSTTTSSNPPAVNPIPPGQKAVLMSGISMLVATLELIAERYSGNHQVYDFLERLEQALSGAQTALMSDDYSTNSGS